MLNVSLEAARRFEGRVEVIDLRTLAPLDVETIAGSVRRTGKVVIVHEDTRTGGIAGELTALIVEHAFEFLDAPIRRVTAPDSPVPYSPPLEQAYLPQPDDVAAAIEALLGY
jgi:pyruvate/2-oxoglutarate/acetoin dehydrogenase E1 component